MAKLPQTIVVELSETDRELLRELAVLLRKPAHVPYPPNISPGLPGGIRIY